MAPEPCVGEFSLMEHRTVGVLYVIAGVVGLISNIVLLRIFCHEKRLSGNRYKLHIQLAIGNIMVVAGTPFSASSAFAAKWLWGEQGCWSYGTETYIGGMGVVMFAFLICVQRFLSKYGPDEAPSSGESNTFCCLGWLLSIAIGIGPLVGWNSWAIESSGTACGLNHQTTDTSHKSLFVALTIMFVSMIVVGVLAMKGAFAYSARTTESTNGWFTENQLNWIATANFAIAIIGFGPYGYFAAWSIFNQGSKMTMLASVIPPLFAKMSTILYPIGYCVASERFRDEFAMRTIGGEADKKAT